MSEAKPKMNRDEVLTAPTVGDMTMKYCWKRKQSKIGVLQNSYRDQSPLSSVFNEVWTRLVEECWCREDGRSHSRLEREFDVFLLQNFAEAPHLLPDAAEERHALIVWS